MQVWTTGQLTSGQNVPKIVGVNRPQKPYTPLGYRNAFVERIRASRLISDKSPLEMAQLLDVPKDTYHRYETRTLLPHHLIQTFCEITGQDLYWLITGRRQKPELQAVSQLRRKTDTQDPSP